MFSFISTVQILLPLNKYYIGYEEQCKEKPKRVTKTKETKSPLQSTTRTTTSITMTVLN